MGGWVVWLVIVVIVVAVLALAAIAAMIAFSARGRPQPLRSVADTIAEIDRNFASLPAPTTYRARDGTALAYRVYPGPRTASPC